MKKFAVLIFFFTVVEICLAGTLEPEKADFGYHFSGKLSLPFLKGVSFALQSEDEKNIWQGSFSTSPYLKVLPVNVKVGNLGYSGVSSLMNNPVISSSVSPFTVPDKNVRKLEAGAGTSYSVPYSVFTSVSVCPSEGFLEVLGVSGNYTEEGNYIVSGNLKSRFSKNSGFSLQTALGSRQNRITAESSWYSSDPFVMEQVDIVSFLLQAALRAENFSTVFSNIGYSGFYGRPEFVYKSDTVWKYGSLSVFYNPNHGTRTLSGKRLDECLILKLNFQDQKKGGNKIPVFWKYGFTVYSQSDLAGVEDVLKAALGGRVFTTLTSLTGTLQGDFAIKPEENGSFFINWKKASLGIRNSWYFSQVQPSLRGNFWVLPSEDLVSWKSGESAGLDLCVCRNPMVTLSVSGEAEQKQWKTESLKINAGIGLRHRLKYVDVSGKVSFSIEYKDKNH